ncbi:AAA family ATPase [Bradyrhizobium sp. 4]|uniref:AAA family ATPase n=1 Tax=unclassified Bradyrhizobium TaxID=2631580 RepID=UPI001FF721A6|nr:MULTISPECIES: AAA family ATPase [unclassified Bradyrhizobium]MCK1400106.1 AAA family ATPase [Bradyrhizobium sp. 39]MCK1750396.1 AAA family ATPase [Bradyrhizobium sp. 135]UPJ32005.1 AAA family ATPase [Bradyrhizobium sp. 4]
MIEPEFPEPEPINMSRSDAGYLLAAEEKARLKALARDRAGLPPIEDNSALDAKTIEHDERRSRLSALKVPNRTALRLEPLEDIFLEDDCAKTHIVKGIFAWGETSAWIAPPGGMKSALLASAAISIALKQSWFGRRAAENPIGVIYFALERADLVKRRLIAHRRKLGLPDNHPLPILVQSGMLDMMNPATVPLVVEAVRRAEVYFGHLPECHCAGLLIFDTFAKMIAAGGGDENSAKDQGRVFANLQRIKDELGQPHIALIGHTGKDEARGARGSNALYGDVDVLVTINGDAIKTATVAKANDIPDGPLFSFASEVVDFGPDRDGDPQTVNIISAEEVSAQVAAKPREAKLTETQEAMYRLLRDAGAAGLSTEDWNAKARDIGIGIARKATLHNVKAQLRDKGLVREYAAIWKVNNG